MARSNCGKQIASKRIKNLLQNEAGEPSRTSSARLACFILQQIRRWGGSLQNASRLTFGNAATSA
jgi:hypothetical protein